MQAASDVNSPVSGEVSAVNDALTDESSKVRAKSQCLACSSFTAGQVCMGGALDSYLCLRMTFASKAVTWSAGSADSL